jgi:hypothetical protein
MVQVLPKTRQSEALQVGQVWSIRKELEGWGPKQRYYCTPLVLIIDLPAGLEKGVTVAQVYTEGILAAAGDVWLGDDVGFAEGWNTYTLLKDDLENYWRSISEEKLALVRKVAAGPFKALERGTVLSDFRTLEVEVASFFSAQSVARLVDVMEEGSTDTDVFSDPESLAVEARKLFPGWDFSESDMIKHRVPLVGHADEYPFSYDSLAYLAWAEPLPEQLPLAACGLAKPLRANCFVMSPSGPKLMAIIVGITSEVRSKTSFTLTGILGNDPVVNSLAAFRKEKNGDLMPASSCEITNGGSNFFVEFDKTKHLDLKQLRLIFISNG